MKLQAKNLLKQKRETVYKMSKLRFKVVPCFVCGQAVAKKEATLEHVIPKSKGGTSHMKNLAISHILCNNNRRSDDATSEQLKRALFLT